ncbi:hypothetical protein DPM19_14165 [Actinomadura craniellae]|uniref:Uncharacterized protein n=1 Tax=Actinomadura craniellae TaxID=2231787 RepID=A0A365H6X2_9ACTN|nr:hypothetical protein [Actinomadura craniellae]RAY14855.1 hypothetical protein DPM19_14165 [Actinomadura craniellae]
MNPAQPAAASLVAWANAWLTGHVGLDEAADAVERATGPHVVCGVPGEPPELPLRRALGALRVDGLTALRLALPAPGDPLGLYGPPSFNTAALEAGEAALAALADRSLGLVPAEDRRGSSYVGVRWEVHEARPGTPDVPGLPEADHGLSLAMREATEVLLTVDDVSAWGPEISEALAALRDPASGVALAPGYPARAHRVAALAGRLSVVLDLARRVEGGGLTAEQSDLRSAALRMLDRAVRRARVAACNSAFDPVH